MKKSIFFLVALFAYCSSYSQTIDKKSSVFIGLGPSIPIGDFSSKDASDEKSGLAATGFYFDLGYQYQFSQNFGAIAMFKWKTHGIAKEALSFELPDGSGGSASISATTWRMGSALAGLTQVFPLKNERFSVEFRELAGVQFTSSPEVNFSFNIPDFGSISSKQESQSATSFAYLVGLGFKYQINNKLGLRLYGDFNNSTVNFKEYTVGSGETAITAPSSKQNTGNIDVGLGLVIGF